MVLTMAEPPSMSCAHAARHRRLLATDAAETGAVEEIGGPVLAGSHDLAVVEQRRRGSRDRNRAPFSEAHDDGAKYCRSARAGENSSTASLWSYAAPGEVTEPLPDSTQMFPPESTIGAAPPIQMAPWLSPAPESTA